MMRLLLIFALLLAGSISPTSVRAQQDSIPVLHLTADTLDETFHPGTFCMWPDTTIYNIDIRHRGASSLAYTKKSLAIKFRDAEGQSMDVSLLGMRTDNSWILDAMAIDKSRMRNRVSTDLWNDFSHPSYIMLQNPDAHNGTHGQYVEVYLNGQYHGLFCLTEKIDRKQLKLKKFKDDTMRGVLYKSYKWEPFSNDDDDFYLSRSDSMPTWRGWKLQYPDVEKGEPGSWDPLAHIMHYLSYTLDEDQLVAEMDTLVDVPVWVDYTLLIDLLVAEDNIAKNQCVYYRDVSEPGSPLGIAPWDMDHAWGRRYDSSPVGADTEMLLDRNWIIYLILKHSQQDIADRYHQLRYTHFHPDSLAQRFHTYYTQLHDAGALQRETERWSGTDGIELDFQQEMDYIRQWIEQRIACLDEKYAFTYDGISPTQAPADGMITVYTVTGMKVGTYPAATQQEWSRRLRPGIYVTTPAGRKIYVGGQHTHP